ncbi:hypothetical protein NPIL_278061 [Nephila pilipes]|uniref:Uncharacterized protein n=1 Tax=Nephila pilipes TaxID=299642 RepID=A0A8X6U406_NEPPI|nr:hypothetical protein NPIL_278061 [Nephila pilipes]
MPHLLLGRRIKSAEYTNPTEPRRKSFTASPASSSTIYESATRNPFNSCRNFYSKASVVCNRGEWIFSSGTGRSPMCQHKIQRQTSSNSKKKSSLSEYSAI